MAEEGSNKKKRRRGNRNHRPSRKLSFASRVRGSFRRGIDNVLGADIAWSALFIVVVLLVLGSERCGQDYGDFSVGETATGDIRAPMDTDIIDGALTEERRAQAAEQVPDVYVHDDELRNSLAEELLAVFEEGRTALEHAGQMEDGDSAAGGLVDRIPSDQMLLLMELEFDTGLGADLASAVTDTMAAPVVGNRALVEREKAIEIVRLPGRRSEVLRDPDRILDIGQARESLRQRIIDGLDLPLQQKLVLAEFAASYIDANLRLDREARTQRQEAARARVLPVLVRVARGDLLVKKGERITEEVLAKLEAARQASGGPLGFRDFLGLVFIVCLLAFFMYRYDSFHQRGFRKLKHLHALMVLMVLSMLLLAEAMIWLAGEVVDALPGPYNQLDPYTYLIPLGAGAILIALLANARIAIVYSSYVSLLFGAMRGWDFYIMLWAMIVQLCGVYAISTYRERAALLRAGLVVGGGGAVTALAVETLRGNLEPLSTSLFGAGLSFVGGAVGVGLLISFSLPLLEGLFNVLTDIRLLELSNVNNPLLSQLAVKAPGSYNHSLVVGTLAEEAANAIGANGLFCRVAACYHDIGKINYAEYFVENQRGVNPHDKLTPSMSALIIASHVKDGIKMAREAGLPEQIVDIIPQHHGRRLMTYFFEKAKSSADPSLDPVKEVDFRYPGPKPQTREAAIFMLADAVEAAARTVEEPTPNRLREMIRKVTNAVVLDGQLDSCDLTFADLEKIQEAFLRLLVSTYHHRVDYPGFDFRSPRSAAKQGGESSKNKAVRSS
jgi:putative nucleotidyltransferase with HDIG domain